MRYLSFAGWLTVVVATAAPPSVELQLQDQAKQLVVRVEGQPALAYQFGDEFALPHFWPLRSPSGKLLTVQRPDPYPHHRSLWIADKVQMGDGPVVDFYHSWKNLRRPSKPADGFRHFIRHQRLSAMKTEGATALIEIELQWIVDDNRPLLDEHRKLRLVALGNGEYFFDLTWNLKPHEGDVKFLSDGVHYAWPYVRMHPQFSGEQGGVLTNDEGRRGQAGTNDQTARWIDYSNTVAGETEGLALFVYPDDTPPRWLTREYGTFGPRRAEKWSGTKFTLRVGESLHGRVGVFVHRGDAKSGRVAEHYRQYVEDKL
ncbi:PmoA family protein [Stieleria sp. ICT_E10.1]|uniref:PmoA family protein n=1 Tax=Stieleria sedimenti TaxID=2976331 RepID=UPI00217FC24A|nr:PmoA family protein [Stieleria sedimenti]MCS7466793.1 PmoA family protein [Stieleria sedimenti]